MSESLNPGLAAVPALNRESFQLRAPDALFGKRRAPPSELGLEVFKQIGLKMQFHGCLASQAAHVLQPVAAGEWR